MTLIEELSSWPGRQVEEFHFFVILKTLEGIYVSFFQLCKCIHTLHMFLPILEELNLKVK